MTEVSQFDIAAYKAWKERSLEALSKPPTEPMELTQWIIGLYKSGLLPEGLSDAVMGAAGVAAQFCFSPEPLDVEALAGAS